MRFYIKFTFCPSHTTDQYLRGVSKRHGIQWTENKSEAKTWATRKGAEKYHAKLRLTFSFVKAEFGNPTECN